VLQHLGGVALRRDRVPDLFNFSVEANQKSAAGNAHEGTAHELFHAPGTEGFEDFMRRVAEQRKIQSVFRFKGLQGLQRVGAGAKDDGVALVEFGFCVTKLGRFNRSTGSIGFWKEE